MRHILSVLWFMVVMTIAASASARADEAGPPYRPQEKCRTLYEQQKYKEVADCFREMYTLYPAPPILFNIAQAERLAGDCRTAIPFYEQFLATDPKPEQAALAEEHLEACRVKVASEPPPEPPATVPPPAAPLPPPDVPSAAPDASHPDGLPPFLLAGGLVAMAMGGILLAAESVDDTAGYITLGAGAALTITGGIWLLRSRPRSPTATVWLDRSTITAGFALSF